MSTNELAISVHDKQTLLVKCLTIKEKFETKSEEEVLSDEIYLPGFEKKPIQVGFTFNFQSIGYNTGGLIAFVQNSDFDLTDLKFLFLLPDNTGSGKLLLTYRCNF